VRYTARTVIETLTVALRALCLSLLLALAAACGASAEQDRGPVVLAASSMQEALEDAARAWTAQGHAKPVLSFAASSALARQIEHGAPADLFVSADEEWMDAVEERGLLRPGTRANLAGNRLAVIAPKGGETAALSSLGEGRLALADPEAVPAGRYARAALEKLGLWNGVADAVVPAENVRAALALVERGEARLGIVYATDALASEKVRVVEELPADSHPPIRYPVAVLAASRHRDADAFLAFLGSTKGQRILAQRGFDTGQ
jgi:molybdate transport system substrate-binding protein